MTEKLFEEGKLSNWKSYFLGKDGKVKRDLEIIEGAARDGAETVRRIQEFSRKRVRINILPKLI